MAKKLQPSEDFAPIFNRLILLCEQRSITISNLLDEFTTSRSTMTAWKNGNIHTDLIPKIAQKLNVSIEYLITGTEKNAFQTTEITNANEKTMMSLFKMLSEKEQDRVIGRLEIMVEQSNKFKNKDVV